MASTPSDWDSYYKSIAAQNPSASPAARAAAQTSLNGSPTAPPPSGDTSSYMGAVMKGQATQDPMMAQLTAQQLAQGRPIGNNNYAPVTAPAGWSSTTGQYTAPMPPPTPPTGVLPPGPGQSGYEQGGSGSSIPGTGATTQGTTAGRATGTFAPGSTGGGTSGSMGPYQNTSGSIATMNSAQQALQAAQTAYNNETDPTKKAALQASLTQAQTAYQNSLNAYNVQAQSNPSSTYPGTSGGYPSLPGGYTSPAISPPGTGGDSNLAQSLESQREMTVAGGQQLQNQLGGYTNSQAQRTSSLQDQLAAAYGPLLAGQGGYTPDQINSIMAENGPNGLNSLDPNAMYNAFTTGSGGVNSALSGATGATNQALTQGSDAVNAAIDPSKLQWTPEMTQGILDQAGRSAGANSQAAQDTIQRNAAVAGNTSPQAIAAMTNRARQTGDVASAEAMADARLKAQEAELAANQQYAGLASSNAQQTAQRNAGAQLELGSLGTGAQQYLTGAGMTAAQGAETEKQNTNTAESGRATTVANANVQAGQEARNNYLGTQEQQGSSNTLAGQQQQLGAYGTANTGANQAGGNQIENKAVNQNNPGSIPNVLFHARGDVITGPQDAIVGEKPDSRSLSGYAPEAVVPIGPPMANGGIMHPPAPIPGKTLKPPAIPISRSRYGLPSGSINRTMGRYGYNRMLPSYGDGVVAMDDGGEVDPFAGLNDTTTSPWPVPAWKKILAMAGSAALARKAPTTAAALGDYAAGGSVGGRDIYGALAGDAAGRVSPSLGKAAQDKVAGPPTPPPNPAGAAAKSFTDNTVMPDIYNYKPPTYTPDSLMLGGGGGGSSKPQAPITRPGTASTPTRQAPPKDPSSRPIDGGQTHDSINRNPAPTRTTSDSTITFGGEAPAKPTVTSPPVTAPPATTPPAKVPPGTVDTSITYPRSAGGTGEPIQLPHGTGPVYGGDTGQDQSSSEPDPTGVSSETIDYGSGTVDPMTGQPVDPYRDPNDDYKPGGTWDLGDTGTQFHGVNGGTGGGINGISDTGSYETGDISGGYGSEAPFNPIDDYIGTARGGVFGPSKHLPIPRTRYGATQVVDHPTMMTLGKSQPQAVVPLMPGPGARVRPGDIPRLTRRYGQPGRAA